MRVTMRGLIHLGAVAGLLISSVQAPFQHAHASDPHHDHARGLVHGHWDVHGEDRALEADDHDSDARTIDWFAGDGSAPAKFAVTLPESIAEIVLTARPVWATELTPHNHDPPAQLVPHLRGPPTYPSC
jgi:hypothetical protein